MTGPIERLLRELSAADIRYLVVGGVAVVLHGYLRTTADLDLVIDLQTDNVRKTVSLLERDGFHPRPPVPLSAFAEEQTRRQWIVEKNLQVFSLWHPAMPGFEVDLFVEEPFPFEEAWGRAVFVRVDEVLVPVVSIDDLIEMKRIAGRAKDAEDIDALLRLKNTNERPEG